MRAKSAKRMEELVEADLKRNAIWEFENDDESGETLVRPVRKPVRGLTGRVVATDLRLSSGPQIWGLLSNVEPRSPRLTRHFLALSVLSRGRWFALARYHDFDFASRGPKALAKFLGRHIDDVFPIAYDIRELCPGDPDALCGMIEKEPRERLTRAELIDMAVPKAQDT